MNDGDASKLQELLLDIRSKVAVMEECIRHFPSRFDKIDVQLASMDAELGKAMLDVGLLKQQVQRLEETCVTQKEFEPFRRAGYLVCALVATGVIGAILAIIFRG